MLMRERRWRTISSCNQQVARARGIKAYGTANSTILFSPSLPPPPLRFPYLTYTGQNGRVPKQEIKFCFPYLTYHRGHVL